MVLSLVDILFTEHKRPLWGRGVLASYGDVTPARADASKLTFPLQLVIIIVGGVVATVGGFWVATSTMRSDLRDIKTTMESYQQQQRQELGTLQTQINEWRTETKLNRERDSDRMKEIAELKGLLTGLGILKEKK